MSLKRNQRYQDYWVIKKILCLLNMFINILHCKIFLFPTSLNKKTSFETKGTMLKLK